MSCSVCLSHQHRPFLEKNGYQIVQCQTCGFLYVQPRPSREQLEAFYQNPDYFQGDEAFGYASYADEREGIERQANERLTLIERFGEQGRLLDVGCASGYFLRLAKERGWQVEGVEVSQVVAPAAEQALGQPIHRSLEAASAATQAFDAVTLWETLEHVADPRDELLRLHQLLKPGGVLALSTPNAGQRRVRQHPAAWREFKPPEHLSFFTDKTLGRLLRACGFEPLVIRAIAPDIRPSAPAERWIDRWREILGDRHSRTTPFWWIYSLARRILLVPAIVHHTLFLSQFDYGQGIEVYARKRPTTNHDPRTTNRTRLTYFSDAQDLGGAEEYLYLLIEGLDRQRYALRFVCTDEAALAPLIQRLRSLGVEVHVVDIGRESGSRRPGLRGWLRLYRFFQRHPTDILHFNLPEPYACRYAIMAAGLARVPIIVTTNHLPTMGPDRYTWKGKLILRLAQRWVDLTIVESDINRRAALSNYKLAPGKTATVYHGVDVSRFDCQVDGEAVRRELGLPAGHTVIGTVGRLTAQKAQHLFLEAAALVKRSCPRTSFIIAGDGELRPELERQARRLGLAEDVRFTGYCADIPRLLGAVDIFVLSSLFEGLPLSILEAMAMARPVVATRVDGVPEAVVEGETGFLVPPRDPAALAQAIRTLVQDPLLAQAMGQAGRRRVERRFTRERMVAETEQLYARLLANACLCVARRQG